jgi:hypothetical protein
VPFLEVTWGMKSVPDGKLGLRLVEGGTIMRQGQQPSSFFEIELLKPISGRLRGSPVWRLPWSAARE